MKLEKGQIYCSRCGISTPRPRGSNPISFVDGKPVCEHCLLSAGWEETAAKQQANRT